MRKPGEWQAYDVIWTAPTFNADGSVKTPAYVTAFHNGVLVQNHFELKGETLYIGKPAVQDVRHGADQAAGARRSEPADQLPEHLGARIAVRVPVGRGRQTPGEAWKATSDNETRGTTKEHAMGLWDDAKKAADAVGNLAEKAAEKAADAVGTAAGATARVAAAIADRTVDAAKATGSATAEAAKGAANLATDAARATVER